MCEWVNKWREERQGEREGRERERERESQSQGDYKEFIFQQAGPRGGLTQT